MQADTVLLCPEGHRSGCMIKAPCLVRCVAVVKKIGNVELMSASQADVRVN